MHQADTFEFPNAEFTAYVFGHIHHWLIDPRSSIEPFSSGPARTGINLRDLEDVAGPTSTDMMPSDPGKQVQPSLDGSNGSLSETDTLARILNAHRTRHTRTNNSGSHHGRPFSPQSFEDSLADDMKPLKLDVLIIGAGLGGLASAYALGKSGHKVRILEKNQGPHKKAGGCRIPPNLFKVLIDWGFEKEIAAWKKCRKSAFHSLDDGRLLGYLEWHGDVIQETGGEFLLARYEDLYNMIHKLALSVNTEIRYDATVESVSVDEKDVPQVKLVDGTLLTANIVIGADGPKSLVREVVTGESNQGVDRGNSFYTVMIPTETMKKDPDLGQWASMHAWPMWMGNGRSVLGYPVDDKDYCLHVYWPNSGLKNDEDCEESWHVTVPTRNLDFSGWAPCIERLFTSVDKCLRTKFIQREQPEEWVDDSGRIVLLGAAAHPLMPCTINGPALAIEDASVLGDLFSRLVRREQISQLLDAYQELRQNRCQFVKDTELGNAAICTMPPGSARNERDAGMRNSLNVNEEHMDDSQLLAQWEDVGETFGYDVHEATEDWWLKFGYIGQNRDVRGSVDFRSAIVSHSVVGEAVEVA